MRNRPIGSVSPQSTLTKLRPSISYSALAVLLAATLFYYPWAVWGLVPGQDSDLHYDYFHAFNDQLQRGEIYPRWLTTTNGGAGSPFFFQYPLPYFAAAALHYALNLPATIAGESHALGIVFFLAAVFLGASLYLWCSRLVDPPSAAAAAIAGLTLPYIWFDFYKRAGIGECIALACIPLAFYFCHDLIEKPRRAVAGIALCFFLMFISNVFTVVMFVPFLGLFVLALTSGRQALVALTLTGIGAALGAGLAGIYLLPLLFHHRYFDYKRVPGPGRRIFLLRQSTLPAE